MVSKCLLEILIIVTHSVLIQAQCNLEGVRLCLENENIPSEQITQDLQTACEAYKTADACVTPYRSSCESDPIFQEMVSGFSDIGGFCVGDASCDPTKCYAILGIALTGSNQPPQNVNNCEKYPIFKNCVETQRSSCEGNIMFSMLDEAFSQLTMACVEGELPSMDSENCNVTGFGNCLKEAGWQLSNTKKVEYGCDVVSTTMLCVTKFESGCRNHSLFKISVPAIKQLHKACKAVCKGGGCLNGLDFPVENCTDIQNSILCLESKLENCPRNKDIQRKIQGLKNLCSDISLKTGMNAFKTCLASSTIKQNCQQLLKPPLQRETESVECKRISDYSTCAMMALPKCENEEVKEFVSETAKTLASLRSRREGGVQCPSSDGRTHFPELWMVLFAAFLTWMNIFL
ncbi:uncharacterized protein LOC133179094 isoform X2 [Saccostrea echinata]|uniref:uncharacterized protein LOC133179094 isoform X2 n=1 Tax=Saccostrea echinata TaxID=191078 RepID=UPI002A833572|nr:uncharacterized protein LOC133179094 isoform X2 [Saccostrea echinata]